MQTKGADYSNIFQLKQPLITGTKKGSIKLPFLFRLYFSYYPRILATTPAPTVRPPSRIAKRKPSSIAIGLINSTDI